MTDLIARARSLIADSAGASQVFADQEIQDVLDLNRDEERYEELEALETITAGGAVSYLIWVSDDGYFDADAVVCDATYTALTPTAVDYIAGRWTFSTSQSGVYVTGWHYDIYAASADLCDRWAAKLKLAYDFSADGASYKRSQQIAALKELAAGLRSQSTEGQVSSVSMVRDDVN